jgi:hypothetical protein
MTSPLTINDLQAAREKKILVAFSKEMCHHIRTFYSSKNSIFGSLQISNITLNHANYSNLIYHSVSLETMDNSHYEQCVKDDGTSVVCIPVFIYMEDNLKVQSNNLFCNCNNKKSKRIFISSSLQYDFCENCKKEIK